jgi:hypothetical protein
MGPTELIIKWVECFNIGDVEGLAKLYHEEAVNYQVPREPEIGRDAIANMFKEEFANAEMKCIVENIFEDEDFGILEWRDPLGLRGCGIFHVLDGKIVFQRGYWDKLSFLKMHDLPIT